MNHKDMIVIGIAATMLTATMTVTDATIAFAEKNEHDSPPNTWGKAASDAGQDGEMGDHASNQDEPRSGIGNVARAFGGDHPSDLPGELCELDSDSDLCD